MSFSGLELAAVEFEQGEWDLNVSLKLPRGTLNGLIGASGAGKSTLLSLIAGFQTVHSGIIKFNDETITRLPPSKRPISILFQEHNLFSHLTAFQNVLLGINPSLKVTDTTEQEVYSALDQVGLKSKEHRNPKNLSGGERQRVAIARTLVMKRPVLLLDEPFTALGPALRAEMLNLVKDLSLEKGLTLLMVSHTPEDLVGFAENSAFMDQGRIIYFKPTRELLDGKNLPEITRYLKFEENQQ
ncbi:MAG: ATP-binding cassette domain-containing protein [Paracoccaceae bacterium]|nr:ATP-binding cassette domain-containing protein [Paracoccaceae bacterium]MDE2675586.1 ATP-binding cassette domain-containing protein [Paracoccaceae bacterium]